MDFECLCRCFAYLTQILDVLLLLFIDKIGVIERMWCLRVAQGVVGAGVNGAVFEPWKGYWAWG